MPDVITVTTPLDALERAFDRATTYNERSRVTPVAFLWPDAKEEWTRLLPRLRERVPQLLALGKYDPEMKVSDEDLEWAVELALQTRCRVKERQKRIDLRLTNSTI